LAVKLRVVLAVKIGELKRPRGIDGVESDLTAAEEIDGIAEFISRAGDDVEWPEKSSCCVRQDIDGE